MSSTSILNESDQIKHSRSKRFLRAGFVLLCWSYFLLIGALIYYVRTRGDRTAWATMVLFSPRWVWLLPLVLLALLAMKFNRRMLIVLAASSWLVLFPLMGLCLGGLRPHPVDAAAMPLRLIAFNVHHNNLNGPAAARFFAEERPDVVGIEEIPPDFNRQLFPIGTWNVRGDGEQLVASRYPIKLMQDLFWGSGMRCILSTPRGLVEVAIVHMASPHYSLRDSIERAADGKEELMKNISQRGEQASILMKMIADNRLPLIIAGDFNLTPDSHFFTDSFTGMTDSFQASGVGFGWTYRNSWTMVRIDHILSSSDFHQMACRIGPYLGSPHRPLIGDLLFKAN